MRTRGQNSRDCGEKELICGKVGERQSRAGGGRRSERSVVGGRIHSPTAGGEVGGGRKLVMDLGGSVFSITVGASNND